jgi:deoxyhypusine monooxygenase
MYPAFINLLAYGIDATVDPAPAFPVEQTEKLRKKYMDTSKSLFNRYRAMFALRDLAEAGDNDAVKV